ncbi:antitoxin MazE-like protein [Sinorhizobium meliloti]|uniref:antitoxin MazE-like protein n=1 Tax=Rhizobium meliloti TaxID=382 RepID=UPI000A4A4AD8
MQIWIPVNRRPGFADECRRQAEAVASADAAARDLDAFIDVALSVMHEAWRSRYHRPAGGLREAPACPDHSG